MLKFVGQQWSGLRPDRTRSTIWRRYSAGYRGLDLAIVGTSSYKDEVSTKPGQAHQFQFTRNVESGFLAKQWPSPMPCLTSP